MKKNIFILAVMLALSASCGSNSAAAPGGALTLILAEDGFKNCPIRIDIAEHWHYSGVSGMKYNAKINADMGYEGSITITPMEASRCITNLDSLKTSSLLFANYDHKEATITEEVKLKNGFGIRYTQPFPVGKREVYKYFIVFIQVKGKCYMIENDDFDDRQNTQWDVEKTMIESIR
jgi:hypothetical protein